MQNLSRKNPVVLNLLGKAIVLVLLIMSHQTLVAQEVQAGFAKKLKFKTGVGIPDIINFNGFAMHNELEMVLKKWLSVSGTVQVSKRGNNASRFHRISYSPEYPENSEATLIQSNLNTTEITNFSSVGAYLYLYPTAQASFRFRFGPGICYNSFEKVTATFHKKFENTEVFNHNLRVRNAKKLDIGLALGIEKYLSDKLFVGLIFNGYGVIEEASSFYVIAGFRIN